MSDDSAQGRRSTRKRAATDTPEELESSPRNRRGARASTGSRKTPKLTDNDDTTPLTASESPQTTPTATQTSTNSTTPEPTPTNSAAAEAVLEVKNETMMDISSESPAPTKPASNVAKVSAAAKKSAATASPARSSSSTPIKQVLKPISPTDFHSLYATLHLKKHLPYQKRKIGTSASSAATPSDFEICDCIRDVAEIVDGEAVGEVLEVTFPGSDSIATSRPVFIKEMYQVMSI